MHGGSNVRMKCKLLQQGTNCCQEHEDSEERNEDAGMEGGTRWRSRLRHCATSRKVAGSIPDGVIGIFH
jgi:hypothetical protein